MMRANLPFALSVLVLPGVAWASSDAAWAAFDRKVAQRCASASGLGGARTSRVVGFDDTLGKVVTLVTGVEPRVRGRAATVGKLCVYDQRSGRVWLSEAPGWRAPPR